MLARTFSARLYLLGALAFPGMVACTFHATPDGVGESSGAQTTDAGLDADVDADVDAGLDADVDADVDAGLDADVDAGTMSVVDGGADGGAS